MKNENVFDKIIKCDPDIFENVLIGVKRHEVRKFDKRYRKGDRIMLCEFDRDIGKYSGRYADILITYITEPGSYGLPSDIGVFTFTVNAVNRDVGE